MFFHLCSRVPASDDNWRTEMKCAFPSRTATFMTVDSRDVLDALQQSQMSSIWVPRTEVHCSSRCCYKLNSLQ